MLTDDDLTRLLGEAAQSFDVPDEGPGLVIEELVDPPTTRPWRQRRGLLLGAAAATVVAAALIAPSLSTGTRAAQSADSPSVPSAHVAASTPNLAPVPATGSERNALSGTTGAGTGSAPGRVGVPAAPLPQAPPQKAAALPAVIVGADGARVVKTGTITLLVDHGKVSPTVQRLQAVVSGARGYVSNQSSQEIGDNPSATLTMRVPVGSFETVIGRVRGLGAKVVSVESSGKDVTASYADTAAQIASLKAARSRFLTILSGANTIGETLTVQQRVDDVQGQIDRLEGQRRVLESQSDLATLTVTVAEKAPAVLSSSPPSGFSKAWADAKHGFSSGVEGLVSRSGRALLVLIVAGVGLVVLRLGWRLARRRMV